jgi:predicted kinase
VTLVICRGLPASGKTTFARKWVAESPDRRARVNRDDLRALMHDGIYQGNATELVVRTCRDALIERLLSRGFSVVCDDTNLAAPGVDYLTKLAHDVGAQVEVKFFTAPLTTLIERDAAREKPVGQEVIQRMHRELVEGRHGPWPTL